MATGSNTTRNAWVQLYEARRVPSEQEQRTPGRPPGIVPRRKVGLTLSHGEIAEIETWQKRFSELLHRSVSAGETVGILTRICSARYNRMNDQKEVRALAQLVEKLVSDEKK
jgi:sigma54-dependent transcription regulator